MQAGDFRQDIHANVKIVGDYLCGCRLCGYNQEGQWWPQAKGLEMIVANVADLTRYDPVTNGMLISYVAQKGDTIHKAGPNLDDAAVEMHCDDEKAMDILGLLRGWDAKLGQYACRAYRVGPRGGYKKV